MKSILSLFRKNSIQDFQSFMFKIYRDAKAIAEKNAEEKQADFGTPEIEVEMRRIFIKNIRLQQMTILKYKLLLKEINNWIIEKPTEDATRIIEDEIILENINNEKLNKNIEYKEDPLLILPDRDIPDYINTRYGVVMCTAEFAIKNLLLTASPVVQKIFDKLSRLDKNIRDIRRNNNNFFLTAFKLKILRAKKEYFEKTINYLESKNDHNFSFSNYSFLTTWGINSETTNLIKEIHCELEKNNDRKNWRRFGKMVSMK